MIRRVAFAFVLSFFNAAAQGGIVVQGFEYQALASTLPTGTNDAVCAAIDPTTGDIWMGDGANVYHLTGGEWGDSISLLVSGGGPLPNNIASTSFAFDQQGRLYINDWRDGNVYQRNGDSWSQFAHVGGVVRQMRFDSEGNLVVLSQTNSDFGGLAYNVDPSGGVSLIGALPNGAESFDFNAAGNLIAPHYAGTGLDMLTRDGVTTTIFTYDPGLISEWGSVAVTPAGKVFVGENTGFSWDDESNHSRFWLIDPAVGSITLIAYDLQTALPAMLLSDEGSMIIAGYGSLHPGQLSGDLDGPLVPLVSTPEPSTMALAFTGTLGAFLWMRRRRR